LRNPKKKKKLDMNLKYFVTKSKINY